MYIIGESDNKVLEPKPNWGTAISLIVNILRQPTTGCFDENPNRKNSLYTSHFGKMCTDP